MFNLNLNFNFNLMSFKVIFIFLFILFFQRDLQFRVLFQYFGSSSSRILTGFNIYKMLRNSTFETHCL